MKKYIVMIGAVFFLLAGCAKPTAPFSAKARMTIDNFTPLYFDYLTNASSGTLMKSIEGNFADITPDAVFEQTGCQIFKDNATFESFLLTDGTITPIALGFGGFGITDIHPCDFDENGTRDIIYTYSWGSGLHRSVIGIYNLTDNKETALDYANLNHDMLLEEDNGTFNVYDATLGSSSTDNIVGNMIKGKQIGTITVKDGVPSFIQSV